MKFMLTQCYCSLHRLGTSAKCSSSELPPGHHKCEGQLDNSDEVCGPNIQRLQWTLCSSTRVCRDTGLQVCHRQHNGHVNPSRSMSWKICNNHFTLEERTSILTTETKY